MPRPGKSKVAMVVDCSRIAVTDAMEANFCYWSFIIHLVSLSAYEHVSRTIRSASNVASASQLPCFTTPSHDHLYR